MSRTIESSIIKTISEANQFASVLAEQKALAEMGYPFKAGQYHR